jgi:LacI family transcriptional regulator/LacI family fructose operon transcriptional repressor
MAKPALSMQDVARAAGVHQTTVSRALRNDRRLPEKTRQRIRKVAERLGYRPHPLLAALGVNLRRGRPADYEVSLAYLVRADSNLDPRRPYLLGARAAAETQGYRLEEFVYGETGLTTERLNQILLTRNIHGLIIAPLALSGPQTGFTLDWPEFCTVTLEYTFTEPAFDRVVHDGYDATRLALDQCRRRGFRRIGLLLATGVHQRANSVNVAAYWLEQKARRCFAEIPPLLIPDWDHPAFAAWFRAHRPRVIITTNWLLRYVLDFARQQRLGIPGDLGLINLNAFEDESVGGIVQNPGAIGAAAVRLVIDKLNRNDRGVPALRQTILIPGHWHEGRTLAPLTRAGMRLGRRLAPPL